MKMIDIRAEDILSAMQRKCSLLTLSVLSVYGLFQSNTNVMRIECYINAKEREGKGMHFTSVVDSNTVKVVLVLQILHRKSCKSLCL